MIEGIVIVVAIILAVMFLGGLFNGSHGKINPPRNSAGCSASVFSLFIIVLVILLIMVGLGVKV